MAGDPRGPWGVRVQFGSEPHREQAPLMLGVLCLLAVMPRTAAGSMMAARKRGGRDEVAPELARGERPSHVRVASEAFPHSDVERSGCTLPCEALEAAKSEKLESLETEKSEKQQSLVAEKSLAIDPDDKDRDGDAPELARGERPSHVRVANEVCEAEKSEGMYKVSSEECVSPFIVTMKAEDKLDQKQSRDGLSLHSCCASGVDKVLNLQVDSSSGSSFDSRDHPHGNPFFGLSYDLLRRFIGTMKVVDKLGQKQSRVGLSLHSCCASGVDKVLNLVNLPDSPDHPLGLGGGSLA